MRLRSGRLELELHEWGGSGAAPPLLLLHSLYGSADEWGELPAAWPGAVYGLDFSGHGASAWSSGGAYCPELFACEAEAALEHLGQAVLAGRGIGAYVALLLAGGRSAQVPAAVLLPGVGLAGGGAAPSALHRLPLLGVSETRESGAACDPYVRALDFDIRPVDYALAFAGAARRLILLDDGAPKPPWWEAVRGQPGVEPSGEAPRGLLGRLAEDLAVTRSASSVRPSSGP